MNRVKYFNGIEEADLKKYSEELYRKLIRVLEIERSGEESYSNFCMISSSIEVNHWKRILSQRNNSLIISYSSSMFYYEKGIHDDDFLNNTKKINWENLLNYRYFIENFFITGDKQNIFKQNKS